MRIYISGSITNGGTITDVPTIERNKARFREIEAVLRDGGAEVVNPADLELDPGQREGLELWTFYMKECLKLLIDCDAIYMLEGWERSDGAHFELEVAMRLGYQRRYEHPRVGDCLHHSHTQPVIGEGLRSPK